MSRPTWVGRVHGNVSHCAHGISYKELCDYCWEPEKVIGNAAQVDPGPHLKCSRCGQPCNVEVCEACCRGTSPCQFCSVQGTFSDIPPCPIHGDLTSYDLWNRGRLGLVTYRRNNDAEWHLYGNFTAKELEWIVKNI